MNQTPSTQGPLGFADLMRPGERIAALIYLPVHIVVLPLLLPYLSYAIPGLSTVDLNLIYYSIGFVCCLLLFWRFLHASFNAAWERPGSLLLGVFGGYAMELALSMLLSSLFIIFGLQSVTSPNNEAITGHGPRGDEQAHRHDGVHGADSRRDSLPRAWPSARSAAGTAPPPG